MELSSWEIPNFFRSIAFCGGFIQSFLIDFYLKFSAFPLIISHL